MSALRTSKKVDLDSIKPTKTISAAEWASRLESANVTKRDLNRLVLDYLFVEGYKSTAENFARESGGYDQCDLEGVDQRTAIRYAIHRGDIDAAIEQLNDLNSEILDTNPALYFRLQQQRLIELIRQGHINEALVFAQTELAPRGEENPSFLGELERTMALLAFELPKLGAATSKAAAKSSSKGKGKEKESDVNSSNLPASLAALLQPAQRQRTASEVNAAILKSQSHASEPKLPNLLKMLAYGEDLLQTKVASFPRLDMADLLEKSKPKPAGENEVEASGEAVDMEL